MWSPLKTATRELVLGVPLARELYFKRTFRQRSPACKGIYTSFSDARRDVPVDALPTAKDNYNEDRLDTLNFCDYPVVVWLLLLLPTAHYVFELGGSIGMGYFAYRRYVPLPAEFRWVICDLPEVIEAGCEVARKRGDTNLSFTIEREVEGDPDVYFTSGTLQYIEEPFTDVLRNLRRLPPHVIVNRVPMVGKEPYITLQHGGERFIPYKVVNREEFIAEMETIGYETVDTWVTERAVSFLLEPQYERPLFHGMYFRLKPAPAG